MPRNVGAFSYVRQFMWEVQSIQAVSELSWISYHHCYFKCSTDFTNSSISSIWICLRMVLGCWRFCLAAPAPLSGRPSMPVPLKILSTLLSFPRSRLLLLDTQCQACGGGQLLHSPDPASLWSRPCAVFSVGLLGVLVCILYDIQTLPCVCGRSQAWEIFSSLFQ